MGKRENPVSDETGKSHPYAHTNRSPCTCPHTYACTHAQGHWRAHPTPHAHPPPHTRAHPSPTQARTHRASDTVPTILSCKQLLGTPQNGQAETWLWPFYSSIDDAAKFMSVVDTGYPHWRIYIMLGLRGIAFATLYWSYYPLMADVSAPTFPSAAYHILINMSRWKIPLYTAVILQVRSRLLSSSARLRLSFQLS